MSEKIALVQPRIIAGKSLGIEKSPASIQTLAAQLEKDGHDVRMFHEGVGDELTQKLVEFDPRIVGISTMTANFLQGKEVARTIKDIRGEVVVVLGGWHASGCAQSYLQGQESETISEIIAPDSPFDYMVAGEGEIVMSELVRRISTGESVEDLAGIGFLDAQEIRVSVADRIKDLDVLSDPSWKGLPVDNYRDKRSGALDLSCHFNRACRFNCGFCATPTVYGRGVRRFSPERAVGQMEFLLTGLKPEVITFTDEDFFASPKWVEGLVDLLEQRDLHGRYGVEFDTFASINDLHKFERDGQGDFLDRMRRFGFNSFTVGVESMNPQVLRSYNKETMILPTMSVEQRARYKQLSPQEQNEMLVAHYLECTQTAITFAQEHGILVVGDYIFGNPGESEEQVRKGFEKFSSLKGLHIAYLPIFTPFPGTALWKEAYESGKLVRNETGNIDWSKFDASAGALDLGYDIAGLRNELELQFYTSERYYGDMLVAIQRDSAKAAMFKSRFNYLNRLFPRNKLVEARLVELG
jgi:radical SAM superfamily enzyme YgiQ (UPF0313 family)